MNTKNVELWEDLQWRGFIKDCTDRDGLFERMNQGPITGFIGFDPTAESIHLGNLMQIILWRHLQRAGHKPIVLIGGATGLIGDPRMTGERTLVDEDIVATRALSIQNQIRHFLEDDENEIQVVNNLDWMCKMGSLELLRDVGKHFSINKMLSRDVVKSRLDNDGLSFTEFSYMLIQAFDFKKLCETHDCELQTGASDQWGNITSGVDLIGKTLQKKSFGMVTPLLTKADGTKFGKSEGGTIWLDPALTTPAQLHQFLLRTEDSKVIELLRIFSERSRTELENIEEEFMNNPSERLAHKILADDVVRLVHGNEELQKVTAVQQLFNAGNNVENLSENTLNTIFSSIPSKIINNDEKIVDVLLELKVVSSKSDFRRLINSGGVKINGVKINDSDIVFNNFNNLFSKFWVIGVGKKRAIVSSC